MISRRLSPLQLGNQRLQPFGTQAHLNASGREIDPLDQQPQNPRLLGREQLVPQRRKGGNDLDDALRTASEDVGVARQKDEPGSCRNAASSGVVGRPRSAWR